MRILFLLLLISGSLFSQENNALPPGPSTISGQVTDKSGKPIKGAALTVVYSDGQQRSCDTFYSNSDGYFTVYILRYHQPYIDLEIKVDGQLCKIIRYDNPGHGFNIGFPENVIQCPVKK